MSAAIESNSAEAREAERILTFRSGDARLSLPAHMIVEVVRPPRVARVPHAPPGVSGVANLRGTVVPILSLAVLLGHAQQHATATTRVLVLNTAAPLGLLVDEVSALASKTTSGDDLVRPLDIDELAKSSLMMSKRRTAQAGRGALSSAAELVDVPSELRTLVSFDVAGQAYALPLDQTRAILALPLELATRLCSDEPEAGVIAWRSRLLPLVSARAILARGHQGFDTKRARIVVTQVDTSIFGIVTDGMREILRVPESFIDAVPTVLGRGHGRAEIEGIVRLDGGKKLVSILAARKLMGGDYTDTQPQQDDNAMNASGTEEQTEKFIVFDLGDERYGLPITVVEEIVRIPETLTRLPRAPAFVEGVMNLRGTVLPIVDQARRFGATSTKAGRHRRIIVIRLDDALVGFVVDAVSEIMTISADQLTAAPEFAGAEARIFDRVAHHGSEDAIILLVDPKELLDRTERDLVNAFRRETAESAL